MSLEQLWNEALKETEIVRLPVKRLHTFGSSLFEYIFLSPSVVNQGDTVVRKGKIDIDRPALVLANNSASFEGFDSDNSSEIRDDKLTSFFYMRGIRFPSFSYKNEPYEIDVYEGSVARAEKMYSDKIRTNEKIATGIVVGKDSSWQFSVILLGCHMIDTHVDSDLKKILDHIKKK